MSVPGDGWVVGLGSLLCSESLQGWVGRMWLDSAFRKGIYSPSSSPVLHREVFLLRPTGGRANRRDLLLEGTTQGAQPPAIPSLLPGSLSMLNAHIALVQGQEAWEDSDQQRGITPGRWSPVSEMLCAGCQHHNFLCQSPGLGPCMVSSDFSFCQDHRRLEGLEPVTRCYTHTVTATAQSGCSRGGNTSRVKGAGRSSVWSWEPCALHQHAGN